MTLPRLLLGCGLAALTPLGAATPSPTLRQDLRRFGPWDLQVASTVNEDFARGQALAGAAGEHLSERELTAWAKSQASSTLPSPEAELAKHFLSRDPDLETLMAMAEDDETLTRIAPDFTWTQDTTAWPRPTPGLPAKRWDAYRALFKSAAVPDGMFRSRDFPNAIFFIADTGGTLFGGWGAGYVFSPDELPSESGRYVFRPVEPQWYIWHETDRQPR